MENSSRNANDEQTRRRPTTVRSSETFPSSEEEQVDEFANSYVEPTQISSSLNRIVHVASRKKLKLSLYLCAVLLSALLTSLVFGTHYDPSLQRGRGLARPRRESNSQQDVKLKDPFAARPRLQTRNGHLIIEASPDKNIDFKTSGSRGTVTINGLKLDHLFNVTRALERTMSLTSSPPTSSSSEKKVGASKKKTPAPSSGQEQEQQPSFESTLRNLLSAGEKFAKLQLHLEEIDERLDALMKRVYKNTKRLNQRTSDFSRLKKKQDRIVKKLMRDDCFDSETGKAVCKNGATCLDAYDAFKCLCPPNFEGATCEKDVDECKKFNGTDLGCQNGARCVNLEGGYKCECAPRFHGVHCTEQHDDCSLASSRSLCGFGKCFNLPRTEANQARYECICDQGWTTDGVNAACVIDINECLVGSNAITQLTGNITSSGSGKVVSLPWTNSLLAAYPCSQNPYVECTNLPGSFQCGPCPVGYTGNGRVCRDLNECAVDNGGCSTNPLVECINTQGSRRCGPCPAGYTGDGITCTRIGACANSNQINGGCHPLAKCVELPTVSLQSRLCICQYPYAGEGVGHNGCVLAPSGGILPNADGKKDNATDSASGATKWAPEETSTTSVNPCASCLNGATCKVFKNGFQCACAPGFAGKFCAQRKCGGRIIQDSGSLSSPRFPKMYPVNSDCVWILEAPNGRQQLRLNFTKFQLEQQKRCIFDYLEIRNGPSEDSPLVGRFCNQDLENKIIVSHTSLLWLHFKSDSNRNGPGFELRFDGFQSGCGGKMTGPSGQIDSPNYPQAFGHSSECEWSIEVSLANKIELTVVDLDLSSSMLPIADSQQQQQPTPKTDCLINGTRQDYLQIFDSGPEYLSKSLGKFCHKRQLNGLKLVSTSNKMFLVYKSQALDNSRGFRLTYRTICTGIELLGFRGIIESPGFPASYGHTLNCSWIIRAPLGSNLTLALTHLDLEDTPTGSSSREGAFQSEVVSTTLSPRQLLQKAARFCTEDFLELYSINLPYNANISSTTPLNFSDIIQFTGKQINQLNGPKSSTSSTSRLAIKNGKLIRTLCGQLEDLPEKERLIMLDTNIAYLHFESDQSVELGGFRIEWQANGCGGHQIATENTNSMYGESMPVITYNEKGGVSNRPTECLWSYDLSKSAQMLEFHLHSDLTIPGSPTTGDMATGVQKEASCSDASLTIYDGLTDKSPILSRNCDAQRFRETVLTSTGKALVRFYTSGKHNYGRSFVLTGWPSVEDGCMSSVFDIGSPFNRLAGSKGSPNYPQLYEAQVYKCHGLLNAKKGRLRFQIEELDIPIDGASSQQTIDDFPLDPQRQLELPSNSWPQTGFLEPKVCKKSGNYLVIRSLLSHQVEEVFCGKLNKTKESDLARSEVVLEQESAWMEFNSKGLYRGRWQLSYQRLCGAMVQVDITRDFNTPNYPARPQWPKSSAEDSVDKSENVCIWRIRTWIPTDPFANDANETTGSRKIHLNVVNFIESQQISTRPTDCLRVYEGVSVDLRTSKFNLTDIDTRLQPKIKLCRNGDLSHSNLFYVSQGSEIILMMTGELVAKVRVRPFENYCGGDFHLDRAEFASLGYPQPYPTDLDCHYFISAAPGARIDLKFIAFDLPEPVDGGGSGSMDGGVAGGDEDSSSTSSSSNGTQVAPRSPLVDSNCDSLDYVEIRQLSTRKKLTWRMSTILGYNYGYRFSDLAYLLSITNSSTSGAQNSTSRLVELAKWYYMSNHMDVMARSSSSGGSYHRNPYYTSGLLSLNEFYDNSRLLARFCGKQAPQLPVGDLQDEILIRFRSHGAANSSDSNTQAAGLTKAQPTGFLASYTIQYGGLVQMFDDESMETGGFIGSPQYPTRMRYNNTIRWTFESKLDSILQFELVRLDLGSPEQNCSDSLSVFDGLNVKSSVRLSLMCGHMSFKNINFRRLGEKLAPFSGSEQAQNTLNVNSLLMNLALDPKVKANLIRPIRTSSNVATLVYENYKNESLFLIKYKAIKKSALANETARDETNSSAIEESEALKQQLELEELMGAGGPNKNCSRTIKLTADSSNSSQVVLQSPDWPKEPQARNIECHWILFTPDNNNIKLTIDPRPTIPRPAHGDDSAGSPTDDSLFQHRPAKEKDRTRPNACFDADSVNRVRNFIVIHDGASRLATVIGRHCLPMDPLEFQSSGRHLLVRYVHASPSSSAPKQQQVGQVGSTTPTTTTTRPSDVKATPPSRNSSALFRAMASVGQCGGQYHIVTAARIRDRVRRGSASKTYANNLNCRFYLFASKPDRVLIIHNAMSDFDLASEPTDAICSVGDYIEIRDLPMNSTTDLMDASSSTSEGSSLSGRVLGRFCAGRKLEYLESPGSGISIEFKTDEKNVDKGFELYVMSSEPIKSLSNHSSSLNWGSETKEEQIEAILTIPTTTPIAANVSSQTSTTSGPVNNIRSDSSARRQRAL